MKAYSRGMSPATVKVAHMSSPKVAHTPNNWKIALITLVKADFTLVLGLNLHDVQGELQ